MYAENMNLPWKTGSDSQTESKCSAKFQSESKTKTKTNSQPNLHSGPIAQTGTWTWT
jgi:hypothetical protein